MSRTSTIQKAVVGVVALLSLAACNNSASPRATVTVPPATTAPSSAVTPMFAPPFVGGWGITSISSFHATTTAANRILQQGFIDLAANGKVSGYDGVNQWSGHYTHIGNQFRVGNVVSGLVGLARNAPAARLALVQAFSLIQSGHPVTMTWNVDHLTIKVGHLTLTAAPTAA